jgi:ABC-type multidrug transport system ATPase subunit
MTRQVEPIEEPQVTERRPEIFAVRAVGLSKWIDERVILSGLDVGIASGQFVALLGANGAGKSTLLKILSTLMAPSGGTLELFGRPAVPRNATPLRARIGLVGHQSMLYRDLSARENLEFFGRLYGVGDADVRAERLLDTLGLIDRADDPVKSFSRGMTQRVSIARALMHDPELILADEPFAGLDAPSTRDLERLLHELHDGGRTIIVANHDVNQSLSLAERAIVLRQGRLVLDRACGRTDVAEIFELLGAP